jgi:hypothetical protein
MITKETLSAFVETERVKNGRPWDVTAKLAFKKLQVGNHGKAYSGAGFQEYVHRNTGRRKWGRSMNRMPKPTLLAPEPKKEALFMGLPLTSTGGLPPMLKDVLASNLNADSKVKILEMLVK